MSLTAVPIHGLNVEPETAIPFGAGFGLQDMPLWLARDKLMIDRLDYAYVYNEMSAL